MINLNLGCGHDFSDELIGVDIYDYGQQHIVDLEKEALPYEDNSVDKIDAKHFFEHLWDVKNCLNECWRVLKPTAELEILVPYGLWDGACKPVHHQIISESWFDFLRKGNCKYYGYKRWEIRTLEKINNGAEIHCILMPVKE